MILLAGGSGRLGTEVTRLLADRGLPLRVLTRDPRRAAHLRGVEIVTGDVRDRDAVRRAVAGVDTIVSCIQGLTARDGDPASVDRDGNFNLIHAGAEHVVLVSVVDAAPDHPMELFRMKHAAEQELRAHARSWMIVRSTAFMEAWAEILGKPMRGTRRALVLGTGGNPINFVAVGDVARFVELAVVDPGLRSTTIEVGGPDDLTVEEFVTALGAKRIQYVPPRVVRRIAKLARRVRPPLARQLEAALVMDSADMRFDAGYARARWPEIPATRLADVINYRR